MRAKIFAAVAAAAICLGTASAAGAAPVLRALRVSDQQPAPAIPGHEATYTVLVNRAGLGSMNVYLGVEGLPAGTTARFSPSVLKFDQNSQGNKKTTLTIATSPGTPGGIHPLTITARHGASRQVLVGTAFLVVDGAQIIATDPQVMSVLPLSDGTTLITGAALPGQRVQIEAAFSLTAPDWQILSTISTGADTGIFEYIDQDAAIYPSRYYRVSFIQ